MPFDLRPAVGFTRDDFIQSDSNSKALESVEGFKHWPGQILLIVGPTGSGKTHLASIFQEFTGAVLLNPAEIDEPGVAEYAGNNFVIDDIDTAFKSGNSQTLENTLFHLFNVTRQLNTCGVLTASTLPQSWGIKLPDLASRLRAVNLATLSQPDDDLLQQILFKQFSDRQIHVDPAVINYTIMRVERSINTLVKLVDILDHNALARGAPITRNLVAETLAEMQLDPTEGQPDLFGNSVER